jgi:hypothetical protein
MNITSVKKQIEVIFSVETDSEEPGSHYRRTSKGVWYLYTVDGYELVSREEEEQLEKRFLQYMQSEHRLDEVLTSQL